MMKAMALLGTVFLLGVPSAPEAPMGKAATQSLCFKCQQYYEPPGHYKQEYEDVFGWFGPAHGYQPGYCIFHDQSGCTPEEEEEALIDQLASLSGQDLSEFPEATGGAVILNRAREAVQVLSCDGASIAVHLPLTEEQVKSLEELED